VEEMLLVVDVVVDGSVEDRAIVLVIAAWPGPGFPTLIEVSLGLRESWRWT